MEIALLSQDVKAEESAKGVVSVMRGGGGGGGGGGGWWEMDYSVIKEGFLPQKPDQRFILVGGPVCLS